MSNFHKPIPRDSERGREMERKKLAELIATGKFREMPGYFSARLARGLTREERVKSARWGLIADELAEASLRKHPIDVFVDVHDRSTPPVGRLIHTEYNKNDDFAYIRGCIAAGDNGPGDAALARRRRGGLRYVSAGFTVPDPNDPHPERFRSRLDHVTLVDDPHDKEAEIFLCGHATKEGATPQRLVIVTSPIDMSAPEDNNNAPPSDTPTASQLKQMMSELESARQELSHYRAQHESQMAPVRNGLMEFINTRDIPDNERALHAAFIDTAGKAPGGAESIRLWHTVNRENEQLRSTNAELTKKVQELSAQMSGSNNDTASLQKLLASFQQQRNGPADNIPRTPSIPMLSGHSAAPSPTVNFAELLAERVKYHTSKLESENPAPKRRISETVI